MFADCLSHILLLQIMTDSSLDDGDVARLLVRTIDLLKQMTYNGSLLPHLREAAMEGLRGMDRKPITDQSVMSAS